MAEGEQKPATQEPAKPRRLTNAELGLLQPVTDPELVAGFDTMVRDGNISPKPVFVQLIDGMFPQAMAGKTAEGTTYVILLSATEDSKNKKEALGLVAHELGHIKHNNFEWLPDREQRVFERLADEFAMDRCRGEELARALSVGHDLAILGARNSPLSVEQYAEAHAGRHPPIDQRMEYLAHGIVSRAVSGQCPWPEGVPQTPDCRPGMGDGCMRD